MLLNIEKCLLKREKNMNDLSIFDFIPVLLMLIGAFIIIKANEVYRKEILLIE